MTRGYYLLCLVRSQLSLWFGGLCFPCLPWLIGPSQLEPSISPLATGMPLKGSESSIHSSCVKGNFAFAVVCFFMTLLGTHAFGVLLPYIPKDFIDLRPRYVFLMPVHSIMFFQTNV
jgi:hypothetical protein